MSTIETEQVKEVIQGSFLSVLLGSIVVIVSSVMKLPQVYSIIKAKSGEGISISSFVMEIFCYAVTYCYCHGQGYGLSTYVENLFLLIQDIIIILSTLYFAKQLKDNKVYIVGGVFVVSFIVMFIGIIPDVIMELLNASTTIMFMVSKLPQIIQNYKSKNTGSLSLITTLGLFVGNLVRIFTSLSGTDSLSLLLSFIIAGALNLIIVIQIIMYGDKKEDNKKK